MPAINTIRSSTLIPRQSADPPAGACPNGINLSGGSLAGIIIGTIFGTLLILWIINSCFGGIGFSRLGNRTTVVESQPAVQAKSYYGDVEGKREQRRRHRRRSGSRHSHHSHGRHHSRMRSVEVPMGGGVGEPQPVVVEGRGANGRSQPMYVYEDYSGRGRRGSRVG